MYPATSPSLARPSSPQAHKPISALPVTTLAARSLGRFHPLSTASAILDMFGSVPVLNIGKKGDLRLDSLASTAAAKAHCRPGRVCWPPLKPLKSTESLQCIHDATKLSTLKAVFRPPGSYLPNPDSNVLVLGCETVVKLLHRRKKSGNATVPTIVVGVRFDNPLGRRTTMAHRGPLREIYLAFRDFLVAEGVKGYGLEVALLDMLPSPFEKNADGLVRPVTCLDPGESMMEG